MDSASPSEITEHVSPFISSHFAKSFRSCTSKYQADHSYCSQDDDGLVNYNLCNCGADDFDGANVLYYYS